MWKNNVSASNKKRSKESYIKSTQTRKKTIRKRGYWLSEDGFKKLFSNEMIAKRLKAMQQHPNKFEFNALSYLNILYKNKFKYTGDGSLVINHRSADAYSKELNTVALFNGVYWHLKKRGYEINKQNKRIVEKIEAKPFLDAGYKIIFIWEDELKKIKNELSY